MTKTNKRRVATIVSLVLITCIAIGGTIAWLTDTTNSIKNTFTVGKVDIELTEATPSENDNRELQMVPGSTVTKDPKITVDASSENCYVYVKIVENNTTDYLTWTIADGWTALAGQNGVYYREYTKSTTGATYSILANDQVTFKNTITNAQMDAAETNPPTLTFTGYAIQKANITDAADGWPKLNA